MHSGATTATTGSAGYADWAVGRGKRQYCSGYARGSGRGEFKPRPYFPDWRLALQRNRHVQHTQRPSATWGLHQFYKRQQHCHLTEKETLVDRTLDTPTAIGNQDWSKFDFTKWNLEGLQLDPQSATATGWVRDVTLSPQGRQNFAAGLVSINTAVHSDLQDQVKTMQARSTA